VFEGDGTSLFEGIRLAYSPAAFRVFRVCGSIGRPFYLAELGAWSGFIGRGLGSSGGLL
jgi:hypothetical protein